MTQLQPRPCGPLEAVDRAKRIANVGGQYAYGTGGYHPRIVDGKLIDLPWTERERDHLVGCDCAGLICYAYKLVRHRPSYNKHGPYEVEDDMNCNSMLGDAFQGHDCFMIVSGEPQPGDVVAYPSFYLYDPDGKRLKHDDGTDMHFIGHTGLVVGVSRVSSWDPSHPPFHLLDIAQCKGPDRRAPGIILTDGSIWEHHNEQWPKPQHRSYLIRALP